MSRLGLIPEFLADMPFPGLNRIGFVPEVVFPQPFTGNMLDASFTSWNGVYDAPVPVNHGTVDWDFSGGYTDGEVWGFDSNSKQIIRAQVLDNGNFSAIASYTFTLPSPYTFYSSKIRVCRITATRALVLAWVSNGASDGLGCFWADFTGTGFNAFVAGPFVSHGSAANNANPFHSWGRVVRMQNNLAVMHGPRSSGSSQLLVSFDLRSGTLQTAVMLVPTLSSDAPQQIVRQTDTELSIFGGNSGSYYMYQPARITVPGGTTSPSFLEAVTTHPDGTGTWNNSSIIFPICALTPRLLVVPNSLSHSLELWDMSGTPTRISQTGYAGTTNASYQYGLPIAMARINDNEVLIIFYRLATGVFTTGRVVKQIDNSLVLTIYYDTGQTITPGLVGSSPYSAWSVGLVLPNNKIVLGYIPTNTGTPVRYTVMARSLS
ncbi:hypothetical protein SAMN05428997_1053 [Bosea sp. CRIB-10]|uniref:hypothetical protein n=1 Tax=Bosea sp. CRIB-10 TaxID=378404 RepID=UPI0008E8822A|nr:hypothetical protein [Bosea sp. CRIB-10]SFC21864.1 hypothetical protein SAMN05428997_1053 [Bosea sp. CRIB-10]